MGTSTSYGFSGAAAGFSDVLAIPPDTSILSSRWLGWSGMLVEQRHQPPQEMPTRRFARHVVTMHVGQPVEMVQMLGGRSYEGRVTHGDITFAPAGCANGGRWRQPADVLQIYLEPEFVANVAAGLTSVGSKRVELEPRFAARDIHIEHIASALKVELEASCPGGRLYAESMGTALAIRLLGERTQREPHAPPHKGGMPQYKLRRIIEYINYNLTEDVTLPTLADVAGMNQFHFARTFKHMVGMAPYRYVIQQRIERAKQLLKTTDLSIIEVCFRVGFNNQSHFTKIFHQQTSVTPTYYRNYA